MRFVALALTILLAAGCQARSLQADAPSEYEQIRSVVVTYLGQLKGTAEKAIDGLDDAKYKAVKDRLHLALDRIQGYLEATTEKLTPVRETLGPMIVEKLAEIRTEVEKDIEDLRKDLEPKREELRQVLKKHFDEYREKLEPLINEYQEKNREQIERLRGKLEPVMKELHEKIKTNVEETKSKLTPIVEVLRDKLTERLEHLRKQVDPYVQDYRDHIKSAFDELLTDYASGDLRKNLNSLGEELRPQLEGIFSTIQKAFQKYFRYY